MADLSERCPFILNQSPLKCSKLHLLFAPRCTAFDRYLLRLQLLFNGIDSNFGFCVLVELQVRWEEQSDSFSAANYFNKSSPSGFQKLKNCHVRFSFFHQIFISNMSSFCLHNYGLSMSQKVAKGGRVEPE